MLKSLTGIVLISIFISCSDNTTPAVTSGSKEDELKKAITAYPDSFLLIENLIQYYRESGNYAKAMQYTDEQIKKDSNQVSWWDIKATLHYENGDTLASISAFEKAIEIHPLPELLISLGSLYAQTRNPNALMISDALLVADKARAEKEAFFIKGLYFNYIGEKKKAIDFFDACLRLDHTYMFAYREKAIALYDLAKYNDALKVLEKAVNLQNSYEEAYYWIGKCLEKLGRHEEAVQAYQNALMYDKDYVEAKDALSRLGL